MSSDDSYQRDSYSHRVWDDLSEVILQYLAFEDMFRLECVSKQFQRTVFQRHYYLDIDELVLHLMKRSNDNILETIVKKLPNIRSLDQRDFNSLNSSNIETIVENCDQLIAIKCDFSHMSDRTRDKFVAKFGPKIISMIARNEEYNDLKDIQILFPKIEELNYWSNDWMLSSNPQFFLLTIPSFRNFSHLKNMKKISIRVNPMEDIQQIQELQTFVDNNRSVTHLAFSGVCPKSDQNSIDLIFRQISRLNNLIELEICEIKELTDEFTAIAVNCPKLKSLTIVCNIEEVSQLKPILNELKTFKRLERLVLKLTEYESGIEIILNSCLKRLKNLTHLELRFLTYRSIVLKNTLLTDFDKYFPKLKKLFLRNEILVTQETRNTLSRLSNLESLHLVIKFESISRNIEDNVRHNCPNIKSIQIKT